MKTENYVYGLHAVTSLIDNRPATVTAVFILDSAADHRLEQLLDRAGQAGIAVQRVSREQLDSMLPEANHQGVIASQRTGAHKYSEKDLPAFLESLDAPAFLLVLDGVQDPHNLGACLRTADAVGVHAVILPRDRSVGITPVVHKVACGAVESVPVFTVTNLARTLRLLKDAGIWIYGTSDVAEDSLFRADISGPAAFVLGSEGKGLRRLTQEQCDFMVTIPMAGQVSSLNVSVAAGVLLFEACRQRKLPDV